MTLGGLCRGAWLLVLVTLASGSHAAGSLTLGMQLEPPMLDPTASPAAAISEALYGNVYEGLVRFAHDATVSPLLARAWEISPDGLTYTFYLRQGVRFHDGVSFDAATVKFSLDRARAADSVNPQRSRLDAVRDVIVIDEATVRVILKRRSGGLLDALAFGSLVMVAPQSAAGNAQHPVGTGPFRFSAWRRGDSLILEANAHYWGEAPALARATFKFIADPSAAYAALMAGDVDTFGYYPAPESFAQFSADKRFDVFVGATEGETILALNNRRPPLDNRAVRQAIACALDRKAIIDGAMYGYGTPIGSHFPPQNPAYVDLTGRYPHDLERAKALLKQAGYPQGFSVVLKLPPPSYARRSGEIIAAQLAAVGIRARIENLEWAGWLDQVFARHDFDMSIVMHAEPMDYDIYARDDYYFGYSNPEFKALIAGLEDSSDPAVRRDLLHQVQRTLSDDAVNGFLFQYPQLAVRNRRISGLTFNPVLGVVALSGVQVAVDGVTRDAGAAPHAPTHWRSLPWLTLSILGVLLAAAAREMGIARLSRRVMVLAGTVLAATAVVFVMVQVAPGDPVRYMMGLQADPAAMSVMRHQLGLDATPLVRYLQWLIGLIHGDFGVSYTYRIPVRQLLAERLQLSLPLALCALLLSTAAALPAALWAAARRGRAADWAITGVTQLGLAVPNFWLGMVLVLTFAVSLHWVASGGFPGWEAGMWPALRALALPAVALAVPQAAILSRVLRGALITTLQEDFIRTARAKGAGEWRVLWRHALPNASVAALTIIGMQFSFLLAGAVIIENVFYLPGLGRLVFQAIAQRDLIVVQSVVVVLVFMVVCVSFVVDLCVGLLDPRVRVGSRP